MDYTAVRIIKRTIIPPKKAVHRHRIRWEITTDGIEEPNCDVGLLISEDRHYFKLQHKNREYEIHSHLADITGTIKFVTGNGK